MQTGKFIALLGIVLVTIIAGMGIIVIWQPDLLDTGSFLKVGGTFGVLMLLSFLVGFIVNMTKKEGSSSADQNDAKD
ncbi:MAG: hypothetical protein H6869_08845 [Rhodospirillales bacterium]|nr:hypothetical protein [Rhodospirillales bacterium]